jgi:hypothetical protein
VPEPCPAVSHTLPQAFPSSCSEINKSACLFLVLCSTFPFKSDWVFSLTWTTDLCYWCFISNSTV